MTAPLVDLRGVRKTYGGVVAIESVDLDIVSGEIMGLIGPNGSGKTTLVNVISGFTPATAGVQEIEGETRPFLPAHRVVREYHFARTFQNIRLGRSMSAEDNVLVGMHGQFGLAKLIPGIGGRFERKARARARELLHRVGIGDLAARPAGTLSYGDQRRVEIARALAAEPKLLMLDEPAAGMNPTEAEGMVRLLGELRGSATLLLIDHNMAVITQLSDRVAVLDAGKRIAFGTPDEILNDHRVKEAYLGRRHADAE